MWRWPGSPTTRAAQALPILTGARSAFLNWRKWSLSAVTTQTLSAVKDTASSFSQLGVQGVKTVGRFARRLDRQFKVSLLITLGLTALVPAAWALFPPASFERAESELNEGHPAEALTTIDAVLADSKGLYPVLLSLKVGALHQLGREDDARALVRQSPYIGRNNVYWSIKKIIFL